MVLIKAIHLQAACVAPNDHLVDAVLGEVYGGIDCLDTSCMAYRIVTQTKS